MDINKTNPKDDNLVIGRVVTSNRSRKRVQAKFVLLIFGLLVIGFLAAGAVIIARDDRTEKQSSTTSENGLSAEDEATKKAIERQPTGFSGQTGDTVYSIPNAAAR